MNGHEQIRTAINGQPEQKARRGEDYVAMELQEIARRLGTTKQAIHIILKRALAKLRARPKTLENFRAAVLEAAHARDRRTPNRPWNDIDAQPERRLQRTIARRRFARSAR